jgi:hypothetical protein
MAQMLPNEVPTPQKTKSFSFNPLSAELNPICHLLALLGGATIVVVSRLRVKKAKHLMLFNEQLRVDVYIINAHCETEMHSFLTFKVSDTNR